MLFENAIQLAGRDSWWDGSIFLQDVLLGASRVSWSMLVWERSMSSWPFVPLVVVVARVRSVTLDYYQSIFGNFVEVEGTACHDGWRPRCSMQPCCTAALTHSVRGLWFFSWVADWLDNQVYTRSQSNDQRSGSSFCVSLQACQLTWIHKHTLYIYIYIHGFINWALLRLVTASVDSMKFSMATTELRLVPCGGKIIFPLPGMDARLTQTCLGGSQGGQAKFTVLDLERISQTSLSKSQGNGAGKWLWLLSLEELSRNCPFVANLTVQRLGRAIAGFQTLSPACSFLVHIWILAFTRYPIQAILDLFDRFDETRVQTQMMLRWKDGWTRTQPNNVKTCYSLTWALSIGCVASMQ